MSDQEAPAEKPAAEETQAAADAQQPEAAAPAEGEAQQPAADASEKKKEEAGAKDGEEEKKEEGGDKAEAAAEGKDDKAAIPKKKEKNVEEKAAAEVVSPSKKAALEEAERRANEKGIDEFYPDGYVAKTLPDSQISRRNFAFHTVLGLPSMKRYNIHFLTPTTIIFVTGNKYQTYNLQTQKYVTFHGKDRDGVGSIAVHPSRKYFAVAEKGEMPNIYIYEYPSLKLYRILQRGTETRYAHVEFSKNGDKLVSLGGFPDFTITVWNWISERVILKAKAYSQDVYRASFSPYTDDILFTSGFTHMKFWKMAQTFTGLKLQGEIAKFGALEMSNVSGYHELPDGKVVSGTEQGNMILWEGNLVKAHLVLDQELKTPLHKGMIEVILFEDEYFITAAHDGYIKWWSLTEIDEAEADEVLEVAIQPVKSCNIQTEDGDYAQIMNMVRGDGFWLVQDFKGRLWKLDCETLKSHQVIDFHSGRINDMAVSDCGNMCATVGQDGNIKFWDYVKGETLAQKQFNGSANCIDLLRRSDMNRGRVAAVGYDSGIVRIVSINERSVELSVVFKAHDAPVVKLQYSPSQTMLVTAARNGEIFFFETNGHQNLEQYNPICMMKLDNNSLINDLKWDQNSAKVIIACESGYVYEINKPNKEKINNTESFEVQLSDHPHRVWKMKMMEFQMKKNQKKDEEEEERKRRLRLRGMYVEGDDDEEEDWDPDAVTAIAWVPDQDNQFIIGSKGQYAGFFYLCEFGSERPLTAYEMPKETTIRYISYNNFGDLLNIGLANGEIRISYGQNPKSYLSIKEHDGEVGSISAAKLSYDERFLISTGYDGLIFVHQIDKFMIQQESKFDPLEGVEGTDFMPDDQVKQIKNEKIRNFHADNPPNLSDVDPHVDGLDRSNLQEALNLPTGTTDISDESIYSIQQAKLRTEEDRKLEIAEEKKRGVRTKIDGLRERFVKVVEKNKEVEDVIQVAEQDFNIDPDFFNMLIERSKAKIEETKKEEQWEVEKNTVKLNKIKKKFYDILDFQKFTVKAMRTGAYVTTFRVPKMSDMLTNNINEFKKILESEIAAREEDQMGEDQMLNNMDDGADGDKVKDKAKATITAVGQPGQAKVHKTHADQRREERKIQRELRKKKIDRLRTKEVMNRGEDKQEKAKIEEAKRTFGEYHLKMEENYEVPESEQVDSRKKRQQMILLEGSIHKIKVDFNIKVNDLRVRKQDIINKVKRLYERLDVINSELGTPEKLVLPEIDEKVEYPEKDFNVTDQDIENYRADLKQREIDQKATNKNQGGNKRKNKAAQEAEKEAKAKAEADKKAKKDGEAKEEVKEEVKVHEYDRKLVERKGRQKQMTELDEEMKQVRMIELEYEKGQLMDEVNTNIKDFDEEIKEMQKEKYRLESDLKSAELKLILLFEELILLKSMQPEDQRLSNELKKCTESKGFIIKEIQEISRKLISKRQEVEDIKEEEAKLLAQFHDLVDTNHEHYEQILAFYEKITKKRRRPEKVKQDDGEGDEDGEEAEEEEVEEEDDDDDDDNFNPQFGEDTKIDEIERLRDSRLHLYDQKEGIQLYISDLQNQEKRMEGKQRTIDQELTETEEQIKDFQKEKMAKLNQLHVAVVLKVKQIQNLMADHSAITKWFKIRQDQLMERERDIIEGRVDLGDQEGEIDRQQLAEDERREALASEDYRGYFMPPTLDNSVLFTRTQLLKLIHRKLELDEEIDTYRKEQLEAEQNYKEERKKISQYNKQRDEKIREYRERQMLRFGNIVDLDSLEVSGPSQVVLDLQNKFHKMEQRCNLKKEEAEADLAATQRELTQAITRNTNLLDMIKNLGKNQLTLNKQLDSNNKNIFDNEDEEEKRNIQMKKDLFRAQLESQAKEIDILKTEINLYKKKGGHIYTKVTTNRRVAHLNDN